MKRIRKEVHREIMVKDLTKYKIKIKTQILIKMI